jgi:hypothetical protein
MGRYSGGPRAARRRCDRRHRLVLGRRGCWRRCLLRCRLRDNSVGSRCASSQAHQQPGSGGGCKPWPVDRGLGSPRPRGRSCPSNRRSLHLGNRRSLRKRVDSARAHDSHRARLWPVRPDHAPVDPAGDLVPGRLARRDSNRRNSSPLARRRHRAASPPLGRRRNRLRE